MPFKFIEGKIREIESFTEFGLLVEVSAFGYPLPYMQDLDDERKIFEVKNKIKRSKKKCRK